MTDTTNGYDGLVEVSADFLNRVAVAYYDAGGLPDIVEPTPEQLNGLAPGLKIYLWRPFLTLLPPDDQGFALELSQGYTVRSDTLPEEVSSFYTLRLPLALTSATVDGKLVQHLRMDGSQVDGSALDIHGDALGLLGFGIAAGILDAVHAKIIDVPLTPALPGSPVRLALSMEKQQVGIWVTLDGRAGPFTGPLPFIRAGNFPDSTNPDAAVALAATVFMPRVQAALAAANLAEGRSFKVNRKVADLGVANVVLRKLTLTKDVSIALEDVGLVVRGGISADLSNFPDADADFTLTLNPFIKNGKVGLQITAADVDIDSSVAKVIASVLLGLVGYIIEGAIEDAAGDSIANALQGQSVSTAIPSQSLFVGGIELTSGATVITPIGVTIKPLLAMFRPGALVVTMNFGLVFKAVKHAEAFYIRANRKTFQFHQPTCKYALPIGSKYVDLFVHEKAAVAAGYDGCRWCSMLYDGQGAGDVQLNYAGAAETSGAEATFSGTYSGSSAAADFTKPWSRPAQLWFGTAVVTASATVRIAPGQWHITTARGSDSETRAVIVEGGKHQTVSFDFTQS